MNERFYDIDIWQKDKSKDESKKSNNSEENNINTKDDEYFNNILIPQYSNSSSRIGSIPFSLHQPKTFSLLNKIIDNNNFNNSPNTSSHNIPKISKITNKKKNLYSRIKDQVTKEFPTNISNTKLNETNKSQSLISSNNSNDENDNKKSDDSDKKESNDDDEDLLSEQKDKMEEGGNNTLKINRVNSILIHPNFFPKNNYAGNNLSRNIKMNNDIFSPKFNTEPNNQNFGFYGPYPTNNIYGYYKSSFVSTNPNSNNQSKNKIESPLSTKSEPSPHFLSNYQPMQYNMNNNYFNANYIHPFHSNVTPIANKSLILNKIDSNLNQPFSLNIKNHYKTENNKFNKNNSGHKSDREIINLENIALGKDTRTTIMIRNIPVKYDNEVLLKELEAFEGKFNCMYIPYDYGKDGNKGYAFLNMTNPYHILLLYEQFYNKGWRYFKSLKICDINYAHEQGIEGIKKCSEKFTRKNRPSFFICTKDNNNIEIPNKYLTLVLKANPKMKYHEVPFKNTFVVDSFN